MVEDRRAVSVGLGVHKPSIRVAAVRAGEVIAEQSLAHDHGVVIAVLERWPGARVCQEAGATGFGLHPALVAAGVDSAVVAPGLVPSRPGDRVKTDRRDARWLAGLHAAGLLTEVFVPSPEQEAAAGSGARSEDARLDRMRARHRLGKSLLRDDRRMPTQCWGPTRRAWWGRQVCARSGEQQACDDYLLAVDQIDRRIEQLERAIGELAVDGPHAGPVARLRCLRGIDTLTAVGLVCEAGDFRRSDGRAVHEFLRAGPLRAFQRREPSTRRDHQGRIGPRAPATDRGRLE